MVLVGIIILYIYIYTIHGSVMGNEVAVTFGCEPAGFVRDRFTVRDGKFGDF